MAEADAAAAGLAAAAVAQAAALKAAAEGAVAVLCSAATTADAQALTVQQLAQMAQTEAGVEALMGAGALDALLPLLSHATLADAAAAALEAAARGIRGPGGAARWLCIKLRIAEAAPFSPAGWRAVAAAQNGLVYVQGSVLGVLEAGPARQLVERLCAHLCATPEADWDAAAVRALRSCSMVLLMLRAPWRHQVLTTPFVRRVLALATSGRCRSTSFCYAVGTSVTSEEEEDTALACWRWLRDEVDDGREPDVFDLLGRGAPAAGPSSLSHARRHRCSTAV
jgi:hypothetical protein